MLDVPVRPLSVQFAKPVVAKRSARIITALLYGDTHIGYEDADACAIVHAIGRDLKPNWLFHMGDLLDCYTISRYDKDPSRKDTLQDEINGGRVHLAAARKAMPNAKFVLLEGNHEDRLRRALWNLEGPAAQLARLTAFQKALTWPSLLGLEDMHIQFVPYGIQARTPFLPKFITKHGTVVRSKSAYTANGEWSKYGRSGASGHTHRLGVFYHRDHNGNQVWAETGCTCSLDPEYCVDPDWQNGCVVMTFNIDTGAFQAEPVYIHNGTAVWREKEYRA
jgi:hypothetical protein